MSKKRLLITGATGFLGFRTIEQFVLDDDIELIIATGRKLKDGAVIKSDKVKYCLGDLKDVAFVQTLFNESITHIIHCAALSSPWGKYQEFYDANVRPTSNLINEAKKNNITRLVFISTPSLYFNYCDRWNIKEADPLPSKFVNNYAVTKREAEILLEKSGLDFISLRPRAIVGRGDTVIMPRLIKAMKTGQLKVMGDGKNKVDLTSVTNVTKAVRLSIDAEEKALNQHYNISNGHPVVLWDFIKSTFEALQIEVPYKKIPFSVIKNIAHIMEIYARLFQNKEPTLTRYTVGALAMNFTMDITKAKELLGYQPKVTNQEAITEFVEWYKKQNDAKA